MVCNGCGNRPDLSVRPSHQIRTVLVPLLELKLTLEPAQYITTRGGRGVTVSAWCFPSTRPIGNATCVDPSGAGCTFSTGPAISATGSARYCIAPRSIPRFNSEVFFSSSLQRSRANPVCRDTPPVPSFKRASMHALSAQRTC